MPDKKRVLLSTPSWGVAPPKACEYRQAMAFRLGRWSMHPECPYEFSLGILPDMMVQFSREEICKKAIADNFDYVGMIDDDMIGPYDLWEKMLLNDVDICAPLAFTRQLPHLPVVYAQRGGWVPGSPYHPVETHIVRNYPKDKLFECDAVGFGAVLIKVDILRRLQAPWFFTMWGSKGTGEDIWFCLRAGREASARVFCDSRIKMGHYGPEVYIGEDDYEKHNPEVHQLREVAGEWNKDKSRNNLIA